MIPARYNSFTARLITHNLYSIPNSYITVGKEGKGLYAKTEQHCLKYVLLGHNTVNLTVL